MVTRLVIFDDNHSLRDFLVDLFDSSIKFKVVGEYAHVLEAKKHVQSLMPDVVLLDIDMPEIDGISIIPIIKEINPEILVVMYTQFDDEEKLFKSLCAGADGYLLKKIPADQLTEALEELLLGGAPMSPSIAKKVLASFHEKPKSAGLKYELTQREIEVLKLLVKGYSIKYIASELFIAYDTCRSRLKNIYTKLQVNCGKEAIAKLLAEKLTV